jgi:DNA-binding response OmpR family regulator
MWQHNEDMEILLVEDDASVAAGVIDGLESAGITVNHVATGTAAIASAKENAWDLVLLDLGLPDMDGQDVCRAIRTFSQVPIIILSARDEEIDRVLSLEFGADDYMVKPFGMRELVARMKAVHRRTHSATPEPRVENQTVGPLVIDRRAQRVFVDDIEIQLTAKEFDLLSYLAQSPGAVCRRQDIMNDVWDTNWYGTTKTVDAHIAALRKKLGQPDWIESVRGVGFRLGIK